MEKLKVTQIRSANDRPQDQAQTVRALGLRGIRDSVTHEATPQIRGMIEKVQHLVEVERVDA